LADHVLVEGLLLIIVSMTIAQKLVDLVDDKLADEVSEGEQAS
jgi:hypothetical protein